MKKFLSKYAVFIAIAVLLILFIVLGVIFKQEKFTVNRSIDDWLRDTKKEEYVVTTIAQTTCSACKAFKPGMESIYSKDKFNLYWYEVDILDNSIYKTLTETYELEGYQNATPYTFITYNGEFVDYRSGAFEEKELRKFLEENDVI